MMNFFVSIFFLFALFSFHSQVSLNEIENFGTNPGNLEMFLYSPSSNLTEKRPLVIALHGCNQDAKAMAELSGWNKIADQNNFTVLYPQQNFANNTNLCFNWFKEKDSKGINGELESIRQMIQTAAQHYPIDTSRIFVTGLSAGAAMCVALLANYPKQFVAGATFAGGPFGMTTHNSSNALKMMRGKSNFSEEELAHAVTVLHLDTLMAYPSLYIYHGEKDPIINKQNAKWLIQQWTGIHKTDALTDSTIENFNGNNHIDLFEYHDGKGETIVRFYKIEGIGHVLPIDPGILENQGGKMGLFSIDIDFHSTYNVALDFELIGN